MGCHGVQPECLTIVPFGAIAIARLRLHRVSSLGVRVVPDSAPCATALCAALGPGAALALTSANASGATSPLRIEDFTELHADIGLVLDGGEIPADSRAGSTVVDLSRPGELRILREGVAGGSAKAV